MLAHTAAVLGAWVEYLQRAVCITHTRPLSVNRIYAAAWIGPNWRFSVTISNYLGCCIFSGEGAWELQAMERHRADGQHPRVDMHNLVAWKSCLYPFRFLERRGP